MQSVMTQVLLLDDEQAPLELSRRAIARHVPEDAIHTAGTVEEAMDILAAKPIGLAFLDVELKSGDGFTLCQYIHRQYPAVTVVFLTGHVDFGAKSYDYEPFDFLVKPVDALRLERTFSRFLQMQKEKDGGRLMIETNAGFVLLETSDVLYISKRGNNCHVHCLSGQEHRVSCTLDKLEGMLEGKGFFRTHQSFLVPIARIRQVRATRFGNSYEACLDGDTTVPVSRNKYAPLKEFLLRGSVHL